MNELPSISPRIVTKPFLMGSANATGAPPIAATAVNSMLPSIQGNGSARIEKTQPPSVPMAPANTKPSKLRRDIKFHRGA